VRPLWQISVESIGGKRLQLEQFDKLCQDVFVDKIVDQVNARPDWLHVLQRGLFDVHGNQIPIEERCVWSKIPEDARDDRFVFEVF